MGAQLYLCRKNDRCLIAKLGNIWVISTHLKLWGDIRADMVKRLGLADQRSI